MAAKQVLSGLNAVLREYLVDTVDIPWKNGETEGITFRGQVLLSGDDGGPEAFRFKFDPCPSVYAHMHLVSQFQLLLNGTMDLPREKVRPIGVHYTDHNRPYGPFSVGANHDVLVLHPKKGGLISMADRTARKQIHLGGRELTGIEEDIEWLPVRGDEETRCKVLIPHFLGPEALRVDTFPEVVMFEMPPNGSVSLAPPLFGRYEVVLSGSVTMSGCHMAALSLRYVRGDEPASAFQAGPEGATVVSLAYDPDALEGGLTGEGIAVAAAEAMARAI